MDQEKPTANYASKHEPNHVLRAGMYTLAVTAGIATASFKIWDRFYSKIKHTDLFSALSDERYKAINEVYTNADKTGIPFEQYSKDVADIETAYSKNVNAKLKQAIGVETEGLGAIKGTVQRFKALGPYTKLNILGSGLIATGTTIGAYILLNQNARLRHELRDVHARLDDQSNSR